MYNKIILILCLYCDNERSSYTMTNMSGYFRKFQCFEVVARKTAPEPAPPRQRPLQPRHETAPLKRCPSRMGAAPPLQRPLLTTQIYIDLSGYIICFCRLFNIGQASQTKEIIIYVPVMVQEWVVTHMLMFLAEETFPSCNLVVRQVPRLVVIPKKAKHSQHSLPEIYIHKNDRI